MANTTFKERQRFRQYDTLALLAVLLTAVSFLLYEAATPSVGIEPLRVAVLALIAGALAARLVYLWRARLKTTVTDTKLKLRVKSVFGRRERIALDNIERCDVVRYPNFAQRYGRSGWLAGERFLSLTGRNGVAIRTRDGRDYFVGSRRPEELYEAVASAAA